MILKRNRGMAGVEYALGAIESVVNGLESAEEMSQYTTSPSASTACLNPPLCAQL